MTVAAAAAKSLQKCLTLCDPIGGSPPGSSICGIFQARVLEWGAIAFSDAISIKIQMAFSQNLKTILKFVGTTKDPNNKSNHDQEVQSWKHHASQCQTILQS